MHDNDDYEDDERPSKSQLKRESQALQDLGTELVELPAAKLAKVPLPDNVREAVKLAQRIHERGGRKRQLQYIGKLMRQVDPEPIRTALEALSGQGARETALLHAAENWRERLLNEGDSAFEELVERHPAADRQRLRQLIRNAGREQAAGKPPKAYRELFREVRALLEKQL